MELGCLIGKLLFIPQNTWGAHQHAPAKSCRKASLDTKPLKCGPAIYCDAPEGYFGRKWENVKVDAGSGVEPAGGGSRLYACLENKRPRHISHAFCLPPANHEEWRPVSTARSDGSS